MASDVYQALDDPGARKRLEAEADQPILAARQTRLYIDNTPDYVRFGVPVFAVAVVALWPLFPDAHRELALWATANFVTLLARFGAWIAFTRARPEDARPWLKWFFVPHVCGLLVLSASLVVFLPAPSGNDREIAFVLGGVVAVAFFASALHAAAYRRLILPVLLPAVLVSAAGLAQAVGVLALGAFAVGLFAYRLARKLNDAFVRSMALSLRNERLVADLTTRTAQLQQQTVAAERAERDKTRFLAAASHDLRQPMHAISLLVGMFRPRASNQEQEIVERLERSVESMDRLFGAILDLSKLDSGAVAPLVAPVDLSAILGPIAAEFGPQAAARHLSLTVFPTRAVVRTDRVLIDRVMRNLVSNAIKYTRRGGVLVGCRRRGEKLFIGVWDTGAGIHTADRERIFEEYFQVGSGPRNRSEGLGLGLAIVRRLARLLGSDVELASVPGRGSRFGLEVPFAGYVAAAAEQSPDESRSDAVLAGKFVLVVDDEDDVRFGTEALLRRRRCHAASAGSVEQAVAVLEGWLRFPDAILTDYRIGARQTAHEVVAAVRRYTGEQTPALIVTGEELGRAALEIAGSLCPVIRKPLTAAELRRHLVAALGRDVPATAPGATPERKPDEEHAR
jgi:signal transduction histidine kinase